MTEIENMENNEVEKLFYAFMFFYARFKKLTKKLFQHSIKIVNREKSFIFMALVLLLHSLPHKTSAITQYDSVC